MSGVDLSKVTRIDFVDFTKPVEEGGGRTVLVNYTEDVELEFSLQDDNRTLKIFKQPKKGI